MTSPMPPTSGQPPDQSTKSESEKFSQSDQEWLDRLSGKLTQASNAETLREADLLRAAILREQAQSASSMDSHMDRRTDSDRKAATSEDEAGAERLMFALRREGLLAHSGETSSPANSTKAKRPAWMMLSALAASILVGFFALQALQLGRVAVQYDEPPTMRGQMQNISLRDKNPKAKAEAIADKLKGAGLSARIYQSREQFVVDADLVSEKLGAANQALNEVGLEAKAGQARITIQKMD
jgi:hypothetical protein